MILAKPYLTFDGCMKRCDFETHFSKTHIYTPVRFLDGVLDTAPLDRKLREAKRYTWRMEKTKRLSKKA